MVGVSRAFAVVWTLAREESVGLSVYVFATLLSLWLAENHRCRCGR